MSKTSKKIIIGFSKPKSWFKKPVSFIIRKFENTPFSHVYIKLINDKLENNLYYHASGSKVNFMGSELFLSQNIVVKEYEFDIHSKSYYKTLDFAISKVGKKYSTVQLFGILVIRLFSIFGKKIKNPLGKNGYICTELVGELLKQIYGKKIEKDLGSLTLNDIKNLLNND